MNLRDLPGELLSETVLLQELDELSDLLEEQVGDNRVDQVPLAQTGGTTVLLYTLKRGGHLVDRCLPDTSVIIQVLSGTICFQAGDGEVHSHPGRGSVLTVKPGEVHSIQAERDSRLLMTLIRA